MSALPHPSILDDARRERRRARRHLDMLPPEHLDRLNREWLEAEAAVSPVNEPISPEIRARAAAEWDALTERDSNG